MQMMIEAVIAAVGAAAAVVIIMTALTYFLPAKNVSLRFDGTRLKIIPQKGKLLTFFRADIRIKNRYTGEFSEIKSLRFDSSEGVSLLLEEAGCGIVTSEIISIGQRFAFSPYIKKTDLSAKAECVIMPCDKKCPVALSEILGRADSRETTVEGVRGYRRGERLADIHMKLSAKAGEYMVRERVAENSGVTVGFSYDPEHAEENASLLLGVLNEMTALGQPCTVCFGGESAEIAHSAEIEPLFRRIFSEAVETPSRECDITITGGEVLL